MITCWPPLLHLRRWTTGLTIENGISKIPWPSNKSFKKVVAILDAPEACFKGLKNDPNSRGNHRNGPGDEDQEDEPK
jgi:hypothetical protein